MLEGGIRRVYVQPPSWVTHEGFLWFLSIINSALVAISSHPHQMLKGRGWFLVYTKDYTLSVWKQLLQIEDQQWHYGFSHVAASRPELRLSTHTQHLNGQSVASKGAWVSLRFLRLTWVFTEVEASKIGARQCKVFISFFWPAHKRRLKRLKIARVGTECFPSRRLWSNFLAKKDSSRGCSYLQPDACCWTFQCMHSANISPIYIYTYIYIYAQTYPQLTAIINSRVSPPSPHEDPWDYGLSGTAHDTVDTFAQWGACGDACG